MAKILAVYGATGQVGSQFVQLALDQGYLVRALVRNPKKFAQRAAPGVYMVQGDATSFDDVAATAKGADLLVSLLGNPNDRKTRIMAKATENILAVAASTSMPRRAIFVSSVGVGGSSWLIKAMLSMIGGKAGFQDYERAEELIRAHTGVPRLIVRPYALTDKPGTGTFNVLGPVAHFAKPIPRADVAQFFLQALTDTQWDGPRGVNVGGV